MIRVNRSRYNQKTKGEQINKLLEDLEKDLVTMKIKIEKKQLNQFNRIIRASSIKKQLPKIKSLQKNCKNLRE